LLSAFQHSVWAFNWTPYPCILLTSTYTRSKCSTHAHCPLHACLCVSVLQWGIYDAFKVAAGLPTTGAKAAAPAK
jgi:hypothetical protein